MKETREAARPSAPAPDDERERLIDGLASGALRFYQLPKDLPATEAAALRRAALERASGASLPHMGHFSLDAERAATRHCENFIGIAQIPMGVVGPLSIHGDETQGELFVPLATTEGALIASINRGCAAIRAAGGARTFVEDVGMTRAPVFETTGLEQTRWFLRWVQQHEAEIRAIAQGTSRHLRLLDIRPYAFGTTVFLRFRFLSGDAMGMNMATVACDRAVDDFIVPRTGVRCVALSGNYCVDKKPSAINFQEGRGKRIHAEILLPAAVLSKYLKTEARALVDVNYRKNLLGSIAAGALGYNAHMANVVAAFFLATGQDIAHVVGGSTGITTLEYREPGAVYASVYLPDLPVGAVGGGTSLATQSEALQLLGVTPDPARPGSAAIRLAEILGATVLAGELSLMAAFTSRDLARAHERLAWGKSQEETSRRPAAPEPSAATSEAAPRRTRPGQPVTISAPGKLILVGDHAVVYGRPALVTALGLRLTAELTPLPAGEPCRLSLRGLGHEEQVAPEALIAYADAARERWQAYAEDPSPASFARVRGTDPAHVVKVALGEAARHAGAAVLPPFALTLAGELPVGSGFGSSAAAGTAVAQALLTFLGRPAEPAELAPLSLEIERRQHGKPSGVDSAAVIYGNLIWVRRNLDGTMQTEALTVPSGLLGRLRVYNTGEPAEATGQVVAGVARRMAADQLRFQDLFDRMERLTWGLRQELSRPEEAPERVSSLLRNYHACLVELGIVPEPVQELVRTIERHGGAAKVSGAGALTGAGAGSLLVYHPRPEELANVPGLASLPALEPTLVAPGLAIEQASWESAETGA